MIKYKKGYNYQLVAEYTVQTKITGFSIDTPFIRLYKRGLLVIRRGYAWDGATGIPDVREVMEPSLAHDALYQLIRMPLLPENMKKKADQLFVELARQKGITPEWLDVLEKGVEWFGFVGLGEERKVFTA